MTTHGHTSPRWGKSRRSREYTSWMAMKNRVLGGDRWHSQYRGLEIDPRWLNSFENFLADMGPRPLGTTLDRKDGTKGYNRDNCRWATHEEQQQNLKSNVIARTSLRAEAERTGISVHTLRSRRKNRVDLYASQSLAPKNPAKGSANAMAKLNEETVFTILISEAPSVLLAETFGVSAENIRMIRSRKTWRHVNV